MWLLLTGDVRPDRLLSAPPPSRAGWACHSTCHSRGAMHAHSIIGPRSCRNRSAELRATMRQSCRCMGACVLVMGPGISGQGHYICCFHSCDGVVKKNQQGKQAYNNCVCSPLQCVHICHLCTRRCQTRSRC